MNKPPQDFGIPMLTEVLETPPHAKEQLEDIPELTEVAEPLITIAHPNVVIEEVNQYTAKDLIISDTSSPSADTFVQLQQDEWESLQDQITERVLAQMMRRVDTQLETRVRDNLADVLQLAVQQLSGEIRAGLQKTLEELISGAVKREIEDFKFSKK